MEMWTVLFILKNGNILSEDETNRDKKERK